MSTAARTRSNVKPLASLPADTCRDPDQILSHEWIETDGCGGYASSTPVFCPTRRYHGLLVTRPEGSSKRHVFLSRFEETVNCEGVSTPISVARYSGTLSPEGHLAAEGFELAPFPRTTYRAGDATVVREVQLVRGSPTVLVRYTTDRAIELELRPFLPFREADATTVANNVLDAGFEVPQGGLRFRPYEGLPPLDLTTSGADFSFDADPQWYLGLEHVEDARRGYDELEDQFSPGVLRVEVTPKRPFVVAASIAGPAKNPARLWSSASKKRVAALPEDPGTQDLLAQAASDFLYRAPDGRLGVNAGYPWFGEWGRDTFISLPGLTLARGDLGACAEVLSGALAYLDGGLIPNIFGLGIEDSHYGSVDAALWFARAVRCYELAGGDQGRILDEYYPALTAIAEGYRDGSERTAKLGIAVDEDGLLRAGSDELNPTWMDARVGDVPTTPRAGYAVEINALWYFLLSYVEKLADEAGDRKAKRTWSELRRLVKRTFLERFWVEEGEYLADVWTPEGRDESVRPNMVMAASLELSPLTRARRAAVVARAEEELLTPYGLRTLSPRHPSYCGAYRGGPAQRDAAYHQGTVWPFLLGFYTEAQLRASGSGRKQKRALASLWGVLEGELATRGLGHLSEVYDGDPPHVAGGTMAQAWNTAEFLRAMDLVEAGK